MPDARELLPTTLRRRISTDAVLILFVASGGAYLVWRLGTFNPVFPWWSRVFFAAELIGYLVAVLRFGVMRAARPMCVPLPTTEMPVVDIFVPTYGEPLHVVRRTVYAALRVRGVNVVWLLDDANSPAIKTLAHELGCHYVSRTINTGAKAGNLNHGLAHSTAEFVACFDADHAPEARFLERVMGWFEDSRLAFVQTPQDYFNIDSYQHGRATGGPSVWHEQSLFHWVEQPARAAMGSATCCGCSVVFRRAALDQIG